MNELAGQAIHITGVVQGVGFRPFVYGLAHVYGLTGWVRNSSAGVDIVVEGSAAALTAFVHDLQHKLPPLARIDEFHVSHQPANGFARFDIIPSEPIAGAFQPISPDVSVCPDCLRELFDPADRRYRYPFINCTNCGPRFTIIQDIPYDRPKTTMAEFEMCPDCRAEYENPLDRRFHAQPIACPVCGPGVWLVGSEQLTVNGEQLASQPVSLSVTQHSALSTHSSPPHPVILLTPQGRLFTQKVATELAQHERLMLICGRYEGVDERVREHLVTDEISIGDYVLTGGELAALVIVDAVTRLLPGVLGAEGAAATDSHATGLLEGPHYTRPETFRGWPVPDVLRSGHQGQIDRWHRQQALRRTWQRRPDMLLTAPLTEEDKVFLAQLAAGG